MIDSLPIGSKPMIFPEFSEMCATYSYTSLFRTTDLFRKHSFVLFFRNITALIVFLYGGQWPVAW